jgi:hypothetical protein
MSEKQRLKLEKCVNKKGKQAEKKQKKQHVPAAKSKDSIEETPSGQ